MRPSTRASTGDGPLTRPRSRRTTRLIQRTCMRAPITGSTTIRPHAMTKRPPSWLGGGQSISSTSTCASPWYFTYYQLTEVSASGTELGPRVGGGEAIGDFFTPRDAGVLPYAVY